MTNRFYLFLIAVCSFIFLIGCRGTRSLPDNDKLYVGADVTVNGPSLTTRQKKSLKKSLEGLSRPQPNSSILGMRPKLVIYNMFRNSKRGIFKNIR